MERLGFNSVMWNGVSMCVDLLRVRPSGTWDRRRPADMAQIPRLPGTNTNALTGRAFGKLEELDI